MATNRTTDRPQSAGLKWRSRANGPDVPSWYASPSAIKAGYPVKTVNLSQFADNAALLLAQAKRQQSEMLMWLRGDPSAPPKFDGTFKGLFDCYERDAESSFKTLKPAVSATYCVYIRALRAQIGGIKIDKSDGRDVKRWFSEWRKDPDGSDHLPRARMTLAVLKAAVSFGVICRQPGCRDFQDVLRELEFQAPASRSFAPTSEQVVAMRAAAHADGAPERALVYAMQYETSLRQWDIIGQWLDMNNAKPSAVLHRGKKWVGLTWSALDQNLILARVRPTKTEDTTEVEVSFDLAACPMIVEELAHFPNDKRIGPMIVNNKTGLPYLYKTFGTGWKRDFKAAGMPVGMWNRDMRAGSITEGGKAGASKDDRRKLAGHAKEQMTERYDRDGSVEAHRRVMGKRIDFRLVKNGS